MAGLDSAAAATAGRRKPRAAGSEGEASLRQGERAARPVCACVRARVPAVDGGDVVRVLVEPASEAAGAAERARRGFVTRARAADLAFG